MENLKQLQLEKQRADERSTEAKQKSKIHEREANAKEEKNEELKRELAEVQASREKLQNDMDKAEEQARTQQKEGSIKMRQLREQIQTMKRSHKSSMD